MKSTRKFYAQKAYTRMGILDTLCAIRAKSTRAVIRLDWVSNTSPEWICCSHQQSGILNRHQYKTAYRHTRLYAFFFAPKPKLPTMLKNNTAHQFPVAFALNMC